MSLFERIDSIYVPVQDLQASIVWYVEHLGLKLGKKGRGHAQFEVYGGETKLTLVETGSFTPIHYIDDTHRAPYFNFHTLNFEHTYKLLKAAGVPLSQEMSHEYVHCCELIDPDGNWLGVCYEKVNSPFFKPIEDNCILFDRIGAVFIPVRDLQKSLDWYVGGLGLTLYNHWGNGADLGVNGKDNLITLLQTEGEGPGTEATLTNVGRSYFSFFSSDLMLSRNMLEKQGIIPTDAVKEQDSMYFRLTDPDGHGILVISGITNQIAV